MEPRLPGCLPHPQQTMTTVEQEHREVDAEANYADISLVIADELKPLAEALQHSTYVVTSGMDDSIKKPLLRDTLNEIFRENKDWNENTESIVDWYFEMKKKYPMYFTCPLSFLDYRIYEFLLKQKLSKQHDPENEILYDNGTYKNKRTFYHYFLDTLYFVHGFENSIFTDAHSDQIKLMENNLNYMRFFMDNKNMENPLSMRKIKNKDVRKLAELDYRINFVKFAYSIILILRKFCKEFGEMSTKRLCKDASGRYFFESRSVSQELDIRRSDENSADGDDTKAISESKDLSVSQLNKEDVIVMRNYIKSLNAKKRKFQEVDSYDGTKNEDHDSSGAARIDYSSHHSDNNNENKADKDSESDSESDNDLDDINEIYNSYNPDTKRRKRGNNRSESQYYSNDTIYSQFNRNTESFLDLEIKRIVHGFIDDFETYHQRFNSSLGEQKVKKILDDIKAVENSTLFEDCQFPNFEELDSIKKLIDFWCHHFLIHAEIDNNAGILHTLQQRIRARE